MTTWKLNPEVKKFDLLIENISIAYLQTEGWDFDELHHDTAHLEECSFEDAEQINLRTYGCDICVEGSNPSTYWYWIDNQGNSTGKEETGDDAQTLQDIISLLNQWLIQIEDRRDMSTDENGDYVPTFIQETETANA